MKDLGKTKYCLGLQLEHRPSGILVHQSAYIQKILEKDIGTKVPYLSVIGALMYLTNCTRPDIVFAVNILVRHSANPTHRH